MFLGSRDALIHFSNTLVLFVEGVSPVRIFAFAALLLLSPGHAALLWVSPVLFYNIFFPLHELRVLQCITASPLCCSVRKSLNVWVFTDSWTCLCGSDEWREVWMKACVENFCNYCVLGMQEAQIGPLVVIANARAWVTWHRPLKLIGWLLNRNMAAPGTVKSQLRHQFRAVRSVYACMYEMFHFI